MAETQGPKRTLLAIGNPELLHALVQELLFETEGDEGLGHVGEWVENAKSKILRFPCGNQIIDIVSSDWMFGTAVREVKYDTCIMDVWVSNGAVQVADMIGIVVEARPSTIVHLVGPQAGHTLDNLEAEFGEGFAKVRNRVDTTECAWPVTAENILAALGLIPSEPEQPSVKDVGLRPER